MQNISLIDSVNLLTTEEIEDAAVTADIVRRYRAKFAELTAAALAETINADFIAATGDGLPPFWEGSAGLELPAGEKAEVRDSDRKHTRRSSNERFVPLHNSLGHVLDVAVADKREGRVVDCSISAFKRRIHKVFTEAKVDFIENGLRKSAISYWLAAHPEHGVGEVSRYAGNSEASCRKHYLRILTKAQGEAWFNAAIVF